MMIGTFRQDENGIFSGEIIALGISQSVGIVPLATKRGGRSPDYVVTNDDDIDFGAAWKRTTKDGRAYLSAKLDSPAFPQPVNCALFEEEGSHRLVWNRDAQDDKTDAAPARGE